MLALAATNAVGVILFATVYAVAGARVMSQAAFVICLAVLFALVTTLWVRVEGRHRGLPPIRRLARTAIGLGAALVAIPALVLMPAFWLEPRLPRDTDFARILAGLMTLMLISLGLVVLVNVVGTLIVVAARCLGPRPTSRPRR